MRRRSGFAWLELVVGVLLIALGIWAFLEPDRALADMAVAFGVAAVAMGVADILLYIQVERFVGLGPVLSLISGIMSVMSGMMLLAYPRAGALALSLLFPVWFIAHCISRLTHLSHIRFIAGRGMYTFTLVIHLVGLILGFLMLLTPFFTPNILRVFACVYLILLGIDGVVTAVSRMGMKR